MNEGSRQIIQIICGSDQFSPELIGTLPTSGDFSKALLVAAEQQSLKQEWGCVCRLIWVMQHLPSKEFVPLLCRLLDERENDVYMEAAVDALNIIPDVAAVPSLRRALSYRMPGDDLAFHFNKKVISALARIGTDESKVAIEEAETSTEEPIRTFAHQTLADFDK